MARAIGAIDDHPFMSTVLAEVVAAVPGARFHGLVASVAELLAQDERPEVAILDLRLQDGSSPEENLQALAAAGIATVVYTSGESRYLLQSAVRGGAEAVVRKSAPTRDLVEALRAVLEGRAQLSAEVAASIDTDERIGDAGLSPREREVLALYADGHTTVSVAHRLGISVHTVDKYVKEIRSKYTRVGRDSGTKVDLYKRALEDGVLGEPGLP